MSLLRDVITNLFKSIRGFAGAMQVIFLTDNFWQQRSVRMYREYSVAAGTTSWLRLVAPRPFMLQNQTLYVEAFAMRVSVQTGAVPVGATWTPVTTLFGKHLLYGPGLHQCTVDRLTAGTVTPGNEREVLRASVGTGPGQTATPLGVGLFGMRALPAGTYYFALTATGGTSTGIYSFELEELILP